MKIAGIALVWIGVVSLLKSIGVIQIVDWSIIWPVVLIVIGSSLKFCKYSMMNRGMCGCGKCGGADCTECKK